MLVRARHLASLSISSITARTAPLYAQVRPESRKRTPRRSKSPTPVDSQAPTLPLTPPPSTGSNATDHERQSTLGTTCSPKGTTCSPNTNATDHERQSTLGTTCSPNNTTHRTEPAGSGGTRASLTGAALSRERLVGERLVARWDQHALRQTPPQQAPLAQLRSVTQSAPGSAAPRHLSFSQFSLAHMAPVEQRAPGVPLGSQAYTDRPPRRSKLRHWPAAQSSSQRGMHWFSTHSCPSSHSKSAWQFWELSPPGQSSAHSRMH